MFNDLDRTTLWIGHIVIRHQDSDPRLFRGGDWRPDEPKARSVAEARALAERIAAKVAVAPQQFEQLARTYSDDAVSRGDGGMLGGVRASQLVHIDFLDALATLKVGEVSRPFATPFGIHIIKRYPPPADAQVAGERIVIRYRGVFGEGPPSPRSRAEALALAQDLATQARRSPGTFRALVERHSEGADRGRHGDLGVYSTKDPGEWPVEIFHLAQLAVGQVAGPLDSRIGFEVLKRVPVVPHTEYVMTAITLSPDATTNPGDAEAARAKAFQTAEEVRRVLTAAPGRFEEFQRIHCCEQIHRWTDGRGDPGLSRLLDGLSFGEIAGAPFLYGGEYLLVKRLDPRRVPPEEPRHTELPNPDEPDYEGLLKYNADGRQVAAASRALVEKIQASGGFTPDASRAIANALGNLASQVEHSGDHALVRTSIRTTLATLESELGPDRYNSFKSFGREWITRQMMPSGSMN